MKKINLLIIFEIILFSSVGISYATPTIFPHGIASSAPVVTPEGVTQGTIGDTVTQAQGSVQKSQINVANGVAGLNSDSESTSPINTNNVKANSSLSFGQDMNGQPIGYFGPLADTATSPYFLQLGGINRFAPGGMKITSQLYGGPENCLLNIQNTYFQQFARCGAGYDQSIAEMVKTTVNAPMAEFGASVNSPSGGIYSVEYTGTSVKIRPGLSTADAGYFLYRTRIYTNVSNGVRDADTNTPSIWFGYAGTPVAGTDDSGTYTEIPISSDASVWSAGWMRVNSSFAKVTTTTAPGSNSGDATDTVLTNYSAPVILVGTSGTAFNTNRYVNIDLTAKDVQSRTYQDIETDYYIKDTADHAHDYQYKISGHTDSVTGSLTYPAPKSFVHKIDGHGIMPILDQIQGAAYGGRTIHTDSGFQLYRQGDLNSNAVGEKLPYNQLVGANLAGQFANLLLFGSRDAAGDDTTNTGWHRGSIHLGMQYCSGISNQTEGSVPGQSGCAGGGQVVWSPQGYTYGMGLGAGLGSTVNYGLYLDSNGYPDFPQGARFYNGQTLRFYATGNGSDSGKYAQLGVTEGNAGTVTLSYSTGGLASVHVASLRASGASSVQSLTVGNMTGTGTAYACVNSSGQIYRSTTACN